MRKIFFTIFYIVACIQIFAQSQEPVISDTVRFTTSMLSMPVRYDLEQIVVTSTRTPLRLKDAPVVTRVISARDIEKIGARNLQQVLESELAGVEFHQAGYGSTLSFQGLDARYILFLINGERMAGETYGNVDYTRIQLPNIERIEIIRGASSVLYGSSAMGAVINIITKTPIDRSEITASARYTGYYQKENATIDGAKTNSILDTPNINADLYMGFNWGKLKSQSMLSYMGSDAYTLRGTREESRHYDQYKISKMTMTGPKNSIVSDTTVKVAPDANGLSISGLRSVNLSQRLDYSFDNYLSAFASGNYFTKSLFDAASSINNGAADNSVWTSELYNGYTFNVGARYNPNSSNVFTLSFNSDTYERNIDSLQYIIPKQKHVYNIPRLLWTLDAGKRNRITTGVEYENQKLNFDLSAHGYSSTEKLNTTSIYTQDEITAWRRLSFVAGLRADYNTDFGTHITPKASLKYAFDYCSLRANYSEGFRNPSIKEMYIKYLIPMEGRPTKSYVVGNPDLKPEYNRYFSLTAEFLKGNTNFSVTAFKSYFRDKIDVRQETIDQSTEYLRYNNIDRSEFMGFEVVFRSRLAKGLFATANYNYIHQSENAPEASTQYIFISPHTATLLIDYRTTIAGKDLSANLSGRYIGRKTYEDFMTVVEYPVAGPQLPTVYSGRYTAVHNAYTTWNATVSLGITQNVKILAGVNNIFDYRSPVINFNSSLAPQRVGFLMASVRFK